ncbi:MAG: electron transport complex subunit RsxC [Magnetococcales bacterium]|nr:electron transport complex subunit RsxC [Magnetococcales bacterium]
MLRSFHGGVHPPGHKGLSEHCAIEALPMPKRLYVPLHQHIGQPCEPCVVVGQKVLKGEEIGRAEGFVSAPVHAPTSGTVVAIKEHTAGHPSGLTLLCVVIDPDGKDQWSPALQGIENPLSASPVAIRDKIRAAGVVGLGGATFPSFIKMSPPQGKPVGLLLINGVECEPYLTCDARLMEERAREIVAGIEIMLYALQAKQCIIGIEDNKPGAIRTMTQAVGPFPSMRVQSLPVMYPQGGEKQLIEAVTGLQVPSGGLPIDLGIIVHNVATALAIRDAVLQGRPLISRVVTVTGKGAVKPANLECLIGTPIRDLVEYSGGMHPGVRKLVLGGPMMGVTMQDMDVPVVKGTSGVLALLQDEIVDQPEQACIRCGHCVQACPIRLVPCEMAWQAKNSQMDAMAELHLFDCIECGSCAYVCPAHIPLVHYFRFAKLTIQADRRAQQRLELDKARTKAKELRVQQEKEAKERQKEAMKAAMAAKKKAATEAAPAAPAVTSAPAAAPAVVPSAESAPPVESTAGATAPAAESEAEVKAARAARAARAAQAAREAKAAKQQQ